MKFRIKKRFKTPVIYSFLRQVMTLFGIFTARKYIYIYFSF